MNMDDTENNNKNIEQRIAAIEQRNKTVEADKAWESSKARKLLIAIFTYLIISIYMVLIHVPHPWINAIVPTIGFLLSTLTMPLFKHIWLHNHYREKK